MKSLFVLSFTILCAQATLAQDTSPKEDLERNTIYTEAFGQGFCWSLNYDRLTNIERKVINSYSIGAVFVPKSIEFGDGAYYGIPVSYNWLFGKKSHHLELGLGLTQMIVKPYFRNFETNYYAYLTPKISYRFQGPQGGLFFRATALAIVDLFNYKVFKFGDDTFRGYSALNNVVGLGSAVFPWPGLSVGYTFK
jgi:hypothetical protein